MAITETAARKLLHGGAAGTIAQGVADVGGIISFGLWERVAGFFADILAYLCAALAGAAHLLVLPLQALWRSLATVVAAAAGGIVSGLDGLWQHVTGFFSHMAAAVAGAARQLALPLETLWRWLATGATDAAGAIGSGVDGLWRLVATSKGFLPGAWAAVAGAAHEVPRKLAELWRWIQAVAVPAALPYVLAVAAAVLVAALVWFYWPAVLAAGVGVGRGLVIAACYLGHGLFYVGVRCLNLCAVVTMKAPGAAGMLISRAAFVAAPALYFAILRTAPPIVAATVFCTETVATRVAAPVAALFGASVGGAP